MRGIARRREPDGCITMRQGGMVDGSDGHAVRLEPDGTGVLSVDLHFPSRAPLLAQGCHGDKAVVGALYCLAGPATILQSRFAVLRAGRGRPCPLTTRPNSTTARAFPSIRRSLPAGTAMRRPIASG